MTTWGQVHVGDTVRGGDARLWVVCERGPTVWWAVAGDAARFVLQCGERRVPIERDLSTPVDLTTFAPDRKEVAAAVGALIDGGLSPEVIEEKMANPFQSAQPEPKFDRWGRYLLPDPETGEERAWTRVSTIARTMKDEYGLTQWKLRQVAKGMGLRPDLVAGAAAADPQADKSDLESIAQQALDAAESKSGANFGTALHSFRRRLDAGEPVAGLRPPPPLDRDLAAYATTMKQQGLSPVQSERIVVLPDLGIAGKFDAIVKQPPGEAKADPLALFDLKSGKDLSYEWLEIAMQEALYAHAPLMAKWSDGKWTYEPKPVVDLMRGLVLHLPVGKATATLYAIDIAKGWAAVQLALKVREMRSASKSLAWLVKADAAATALHNVKRASREELAALWERLNKAGLWTEEINAAAMARFAELKEVSA